MAWVDAAGDGGAVAATRAYLATVMPTAAPETALAWAERALTELPDDDTAFRGIARMSLGQAALALGRLDRAERAFTEVARTDGAAGLVQGGLTATTQQVNVQRLRGARREALADARQALDGAGDQAVPSTVGRLKTVLADLLIDANELAAAGPLAIDGLAAPREYGNAPPLVLLASLPVIRLRLAQGDTAAAEAVLAEVGPLVRHGPYAMVSRLLEAAEARVRLARGANAVEWALATAWTGPVDPATLPDLLRFGVAGVEAVGVTPARVLVARGRATGDETLLRRARLHLDAAATLADDRGIGWLRLRVLILRALLADACGEAAAALRSVAAAVARAEVEGVVRPFVDEGERAAALLAALPPSPHRDTVLAAFPGGRRIALPEPLTERELDVLRLLAAGRSNAGMAADLFLGLSTVKTHLIHVYGKLGVHSRTAAVARARTLGLID